MSDHELPAICDHAKKISGNKQSDWQLVTKLPRKQAAPTIQSGATTQRDWQVEPASISQYFNYKLNHLLTIINQCFKP